jgi:hypothetical protein
MSIPVCAAAASSPLVLHPGPLERTRIFWNYAVQVSYTDLRQGMRITGRLGGCSLRE